jgi:hypothetical protein
MKSIKKSNVVTPAAKGFDPKLKPFLCNLMGARSYTTAFNKAAAAEAAETAAASALEKTTKTSNPASTTYFP